MVCPKCGSNNVTVQLMNVKKKKGFIARFLLFFIKLLILILSFLWWLILMLLSLVIPALRSKKEVMGKFCVCQNCGYSWKIK